MWERWNLTTFSKKWKINTSGSENDIMIIWVVELSCYNIYQLIVLSNNFTCWWSTWVSILYQLSYLPNVSNGSPINHYRLLLFSHVRPTPTIDFWLQPWITNSSYILRRPPLRNQLWRPIFGSNNKLRWPPSHDEF